MSIDTSHQRDDSTSTKYRAFHVIFDFDGTLIDSSRAILDSLKQVLSAKGIVPSKRLDSSLIGPPLKSTLTTLTGISNDEVIDSLAQDFCKLYDTQGLFFTSTYPGTEGLLTELRASGFRMYLATNKRSRPTHLLLDHFGWTRYFDLIYCVDSAPTPFVSKGEMVSAVIQEAGINRGDCVYIGDTVHDERGASEAAVQFIATAWGYGTGEQAVQNRMRIVDSQETMLQRIRRMALVESDYIPM